MGIRASARVILGAVVSIGMLAMVPNVVFAADPACGDVLATNTTLHADLDCSGYAGSALTLGAKAITLNLGGHTLTGYAGDDTYAAVDISGYKDTTVTNGTIANAGYGVYASHANRITLSSLTINAETGAFSDDYGVYMEYSAGSTISHLVVTGPYYGLYLYGNASGAVSNNTLTDDYSGTYTEYESRDTYSHNTTHAPYGFVDYYGGGNSYVNNNASGGISTGFYLYCDSYGAVTVTGNTANNNGDDGIYTEECYVDPPGSPATSLISGNTANGNGSDGFDDYYSIGATFTKNTANSNGSDGFYIDYPGDHHITRNVAKHNIDSGIELADNYGIGYGVPKDISRNLLKWNEYGIYAAYGVPNGVCHGNTVRHSSAANYFSISCS